MTAGSAASKPLLCYALLGTAAAAGLPQAATRTLPGPASHRSRRLLARLPVVVRVQRLGGDAAQQLAGEEAQQRPGQVQGLEDGAVLVQALQGAEGAGGGRRGQGRKWVGVEWAARKWAGC